MFLHKMLMEFLENLFIVILMPPWKFARLRTAVLEFIKSSKTVVPVILSSFAKVSPKALGLWGLRVEYTPTLWPFRRGGFTLAL